MGINSYSILTEALQDLARRGFKDSFTVDEKGLRNTATGNILHPDDVTIVEYHRFEGESNPDDTSVVYALECRDGSRGLVIDAYGIYADPLIGNFLKDVKLKEGL